MLIASLIELPIVKTRMWQKHKIHLANFDKASLRVIWFRWRLRSHPAHQNDLARFWCAALAVLSGIRFGSGEKSMCTAVGYCALICEKFWDNVVYGVSGTIFTYEHL